MGGRHSKLDTWKLLTFERSTAVALPTSAARSSRTVLISVLMVSGIGSPGVDEDQRLFRNGPLRHPTSQRTGASTRS